MDAYAWILFVGMTAAAGAVVVGLLWVISRQNADFEALLTRNAELDEQLNAELSANQQLMLEREFEAAVRADKASHGVSSAKLPVCVTLRADELVLCQPCRTGSTRYPSGQ